MAKRPSYPRSRNAGSRVRRRRSNPQRLVSLVKRDGVVIEFRIAAKLHSPNIWRKHWSIGHKLMKFWLHAFTNALSVNAGFDSMARFRLEGHLPPCPKMQMRVMVTRQVPSTRNFLKDDDDLRYTTKPLNDALKHSGLNYDDARVWLEKPMPLQERSQNVFSSTTAPV